MAQTFTELHIAGFGRWKLPTSRQIEAIADRLRLNGDQIPLGRKSFAIALHRIRLTDPTFLT